MLFSRLCIVGDFVFYKNTKLKNEEYVYLYIKNSIFDVFIFLSNELSKLNINKIAYPYLTLCGERGKVRFWRLQEHAHI